MKYSIRSKNRSVSARDMDLVEKNYAQQRKLVKQMDRFCDSGDTLDLFRGIYLEIRNQLGNLRGKRILAVSERPDFVRFLREGEGAAVTTFGSPSPKRFQAGHFEHQKEQFDCVVAAAVFEEEAFYYSDGSTKFGHKPESIANPSYLYLPTTLRAQLNTSENEPAWIKERIQALRNMNTLLKPGGKVIITGRSSKTIFKPKEITSTGFRIIKLNEPDATNYRRITVLEKVK